MSSAPSPMDDWRTRINVECSFRPLPTSQRIRAFLFTLLATVRSHARVLD